MNKSEQIEEILENFDFCKVHLTMLALDWKWAAQGGQALSVPSVAQLKERARELLVDVIESRAIACGGFVARNSSGYLSLEFVVADWAVEEEG